MSDIAGNNHQNKIFPRNLTAKAAHLVKGNPMNSRPEDSVENCYPGLEFDQRNIEKVFFPGLSFEFHRENSFDPLARADLNLVYLQPVLREVKFSAVLKATDTVYPQTPDNAKIFIWRIEAPELGLDLDTSGNSGQSNESGLSWWAFVREIPSGVALKILVAPATTFENKKLFAKALDGFNNTGKEIVERDEKGKLLWGALYGNRTMMIDADTGVINTTTIEPGDLTRSLCNPWQYDFRDCKCYYWAANKPDMVSNIDGSVEFLDFLRKDRNHFPPAPATTEAGWLGQEITHVDMISNWQQLPVVLNDREVNYTVLDVIDSLRGLAPVEHALCVEYLYTYYSMDTSKVKAAADEVLRIAIDEMRHFRWVNDMLSILKVNPVVDRAKNYGSAFNGKLFSLEQMTRERLAWFLDVERPSQSINVPGQIDGMYVRLHDKIDNNRDVFPKAEKLMEIIKLIIDEGDGHYHRYEQIENTLNQFWNSGESFLYPLNYDPPTPIEKIYQEISNKAYLLLLAGLQISFSVGESSSGQIIQFAIRSMHMMDKFNKLLAITGKLPDFEMPPLWIFESPDLVEIINEVKRQIKALQEKLKSIEPIIADPTKHAMLGYTAQHFELQGMATETLSNQLDTLDQMSDALEKLKPISNQPGAKEMPAHIKPE
jgi:hypothetical protein